MSINCPAQSFTFGKGLGFIHSKNYHVSSWLFIWLYQQGSSMLSYLINVASCPAAVYVE